jgi:parallel beta-helix repeat protein
MSFNSYGIKLHFSGNNSITDNEIIENELGVYLKNSSENVLSGNSINTNTVCGVSLNSSIDNILHNNEIKNNSECGLFFSDSKSNLIYNNYFNNKINIYLQGTNPENNLNVNKTRALNIVNGPYIGGNFCGTPTGDGFSQVQLDKDGDGICDAAYSADEEISDYLPLAASNTVH